MPYACTHARVHAHTYIFTSHVRLYPYIYRSAKLMSLDSKVTSKFCINFNVGECQMRGLLCKGSTHVCSQCSTQFFIRYHPGQLWKTSIHHSSFISWDASQASLTITTHWVLCQDSLVNFIKFFGIRMLHVEHLHCCYLKAIFLYFWYYISQQTWTHKASF